MPRKAPWRSKRRGCHPVIGEAKDPLTRLWTRIHLGEKLHVCFGEDPRAGQVWKKKPDNWPKVNKSGRSALCE